MTGLTFNLSGSNVQKNTILNITGNVIVCQIIWIGRKAAIIIGKAVHKNIFGGAIP